MAAIIEHTPEWYAARRTGITSTDIGAILGVSPYASEGDVARSKMSDDPEPEPDPETARRFRLGLAMQSLVADEDVVEHGIKLRRVKRLIVHPTIPWAMTSADYERVGERTLVEVKTSTAREWDQGLPERVEAQVRWQMGVAEYPAAHVVVLRYGARLTCYDVAHDEAVWQNLLLIAGDFRTRVAAGGPFDESAASVRRAYPLDDGSEITASADPVVVEAVRDLLRVRTNKAQIETREEALVAAIQMRMGEASVLTGPGFRVTWKRTKDSQITDWHLLASGLLNEREEEEKQTLISLHSTTRDGYRRFVVKDLTLKDDER